MNSAKTYERTLGALVAEARVGRVGRIVAGAPRDPESSRPRGSRTWINGKEVGESNPRFAHLGRVYD